MKILRKNVSPQSPAQQTERQNEEILRLYELQLKSIAANFKLYEDGGREQSAKALSSLFFGLTRIMSPDLFIEAGALTAESSLRARKICPNARIVAFEANPYNYEKYAKELNHGLYNVEYLNYAISDAPGITTFNVIKSINGVLQEKHTGRNSLLERSQGDVEYEKVSVQSTTIDIFFNAVNLKDRVIIWIDVEGATQQVLTGAQNILKNVDVIMIEVEDFPKWKDQWTSSSVIKYLYQFGFIPVARDFEYRTQYNIIFLSNRAFYNPEVKVNLDYYFSVLCANKQ